ncbi:hypothetical protein VTJ49DRAFT_3407 [Mycothermus thermophilus]|uniref:Uncharacterized protein n=1 Tax=Humicola insolens TaxID=85995 RepID=A0ABR3V7P5_HUMIN
MAIKVGTCLICRAGFRRWLESMHMCNFDEARSRRGPGYIFTIHIASNMKDPNSLFMMALRKLVEVSRFEHHDAKIEGNMVDWTVTELGQRG